MITLKVGEILNIDKTIKEIINDSTIQDALTKFKLLGILHKLEPYILNYNVIKNDKIKEYGEKNEDGSIMISPDNKEAIQKFSDSLNPVLNSDIDVPLEKLKAIDVFNKGINAEHLIGLYSIIEQ